MKSDNRAALYSQKNKGYTLLELMTAVLIAAILVALALPSYNQYIRRAARAEAQSAMLSIAEQLSRHRARYLSYVKFTPQLGYAYVDTAKTEIYIPSNSTITDYKYKLTIVDLSDRTRSLHANEASGQGWYMLASPNPSGILKANENLLLDSVGLRCMSVAVILITATDCGSSGVPWE